MDEWDSATESEIEALCDEIQTHDEAVALRKLLPGLREALKASFAAGQQDEKLAAAHDDPLPFLSV